MDKYSTLIESEETTLSDGRAVTMEVRTVDMFQQMEDPENAEENILDAVSIMARDRARKYAECEAYKNIIQAALQADDADIRGVLTGQATIRTAEEIIVALRDATGAERDEMLNHLFKKYYPYLQKNSPVIDQLKRTYLLHEVTWNAEIEEFAFRGYLKKGTGEFSKYLSKIEWIRAGER